eukprot:gene27323-33660_t
MSTIPELLELLVMQIKSQGDLLQRHFKLNAELGPGCSLSGAKGHQQFADLRHVSGRLVAPGADREMRGAERETALHVAAAGGHLETVEVLLRLGCHVDARDAMQRTPLHVCVHNGHMETAEVLLRTGADVAAQDLDLHTPLHMALCSAARKPREGHSAVAGSWTREVACMQASDDAGETPARVVLGVGQNQVCGRVHWGGEHKAQLTSVRVAAQKGFERVARETPARATPQQGRARNSRHWAGTAKDVWDVGRSRLAPNTALAKKSACTEEAATEEDDVGEEAAIKKSGAEKQAESLHVAEISKNKTPVETVCQLRSGRMGPVESAPASAHEVADADAQDQGTGADGRVAPSQLHLAACDGRKDEVERLLQGGEDMGIRDADLRTPLHVAAHNGHTAAVEVLLQAGSDADSRDMKQRTPLHLAACGGHTAAVGALLEAKAAIEAHTESGLTPLHFAAYRGHAGIVEVLLRAGAEVDSQDRSGCTPLHAAAGSGSTSATEALLRGGAMKDPRDRHESTPLHRAVRMAQTGTVEALLRTGADVEAKDRIQRTPMQWAMHEGHKETVEALLRWRRFLELAEEALRSAKDLAVFEKEVAEAAIETIAIAATKQVVRTVGELGGAGRVKELGLKPRLTPGIIPHQLRTVDSAGRTCVVKPKTATEMKDAAVQIVRIEEERIDHLLAEAQAGEREFLRLLRIGGPAAGGAPVRWGDVTRRLSGTEWNTLISGGQGIAPGLSVMKLSFLRFFPREVQECFRELIDTMLALRPIPVILKRVRIVCIPKTPKPGHRPLSMVEELFKAVEGTLFARLEDVRDALPAGAILSEHNVAYDRGRGTQHAHAIDVMVHEDALFTGNTLRVVQ